MVISDIRDVRSCALTELKRTFVRERFLLIFAAGAAASTNQNPPTRATPTLSPAYITVQGDESGGSRRYGTTSPLSLMVSGLL